jgi:hypothetical protein
MRMQWALEVARSAGADRATADRVAALACAARLEPWPDIRSAARFTDSAAVRLADREFVPWLAGADTDADAFRRRLALALVCARPRHGAGRDQVMKMARAVHVWLSGSRR